MTHLVALEDGGGTAFPTGGPSAVAEPLRIYMPHADACDWLLLVVSDDGRYRGVDHERDEEQEREDRDYCCCSEAQGRVELCLVQ